MDYPKKEKSQYVKETFNSIAGKYDFMNTLMSFGMDRLWRRKTVEIVKAGPGMKVVDVCCGTGKLSKELAIKVAPQGNVIGIDFSENMLEKGRENLLDFTYKENITLLQGDAMNIKFEDNLFDGATIGWGLRNLPDPRLGIQELVRVVKPGAMVVSIDMGKPTVPVFKQFYWLYFERIIPLLGKIGAGKKGAYHYLFQSANEFMSQSELESVFQECGLINTQIMSFLGGAVAIVSGQKKEG